MNFQKNSLVYKLQKLKPFIPLPVYQFLSSWDWNYRTPGRWWDILSGEVPTNYPFVYYGHDHIPKPGEPAHGGILKFQRMQKDFPNSPRSFNILYMGSSSIPKDWRQLYWLAHKKGARFVWNQNGVAYPAWHGHGWERTNDPMIRLLHGADYVFYQSRFCKLSADQFLGKRCGPHEILYNAVDTELFVPPHSAPCPEHLVLLSAGSITSFYRFESAVRTIALVVRHIENARLIIAGRLAWHWDEGKVQKDAYTLLNELKVRDVVTLLPSYSQNKAPLVFQAAHILLHSQYNDACPTTVLEAMSSGLPVVYSKSGGVPELVGDEAGIGIVTESDWEQEFPPNPEALAEAVLQIVRQRDRYAEAARQRAVECFDLRPWLQRHREVFEELLSG